MRTRVSRRVKLLIAANLMAGAFLFTRPQSAVSWDTYCPPSATGCDCLRGVAFIPDGCYDNLGSQFLCSSNQYCTQ